MLKTSSVPLFHPRSRLQIPFLLRSHLKIEVCWAFLEISGFEFLWWYFLLQKIIVLKVLTSQGLIYIFILVPIYIILGILLSYLPIVLRDLLKVAKPVPISSSLIHPSFQAVMKMKNLLYYFFFSVCQLPMTECLKKFSTSELQGALNINI